MKREISFQSLVIPFKEKFAHNTAIREETETIIVKITNQDGLIGLGESCPRSYVTGETIESAKAFILTTIPQLDGINSLQDLKDFMIEKSILIDKNPAAWCSLETATLDILAKEKQISVEELLGLKLSFNKKSYTGIIGIDSFSRFAKRAIMFRAAGLSDFKIKLSGQMAVDKKALKFLNFLAKEIRVDGNNLFSTLDESLIYLNPLKKYIWAIEEPLPPNSFQDMIDLSKALGIKIILDESFLNLSSFESLQNKNEIFIPNLRISKLGGVLRTLELIDRLEKNNFQWILGTHVGEMSLLTRASLLISGKNGPLLMAKEGAFSTHLIKQDPFYPNLKLALGGKVGNCESIGKLGWGMTYSFDKNKI